MTNFERIKMMDAYDMAEFLEHIYDEPCRCCGLTDKKRDDCARGVANFRCSSGRYKWLMQEAVEE